MTNAPTTPADTTAAAKGSAPACAAPDLKRMEQAVRQYDGRGHQEREPRDCLPRDALRPARRYRDAGTGNAGYDGEYLREAHGEAALRAHIVQPGSARPSCPPHIEHAPMRISIAPISAGFLNVSMYLSSSTPATAPGIVASTISQKSLPSADLGLVKPGLDEPDPILDEIQYHRRGRAQVHRHVERDARIVPAEQPRHEHQVGGAGNGQELRDPLHNARIVSPEKCSSRSPSSIIQTYIARVCTMHSHGLQAHMPGGFASCKEN